MIYFDNNSTTPLDPKVLQVMMPYLTNQFGNASSKNHEYGKFAATAVDTARRQIAELIGCVKEEIIFTSGATESINLAIKGVFETYRTKGNHIITVKTEHSAVLDTCKYLETQGAQIDYLNVDSQGLIDIKELKGKITSNTILVCVMLVNNETGVIQPVREIAEIVHHHNLIFMSDATQAIGKMKMSVDEYGIDLMPMSAHKFYGPKGIGCLYVRRKNPRVSLSSLIHGGGHERGLRSGTLNVPGIVGMGAAAQLINEEENIHQTRSLRDKLESTLLETGMVRVNGSIKDRVNNTSNLMFKGFEAEKLMLALHETLAISTGSACSTERNELSHVLKSMGLSDSEVRSSLRFSLGRFNTMNEITIAIESIKQILTPN